MAPHGAILDDRMANELQAVIAELGGEKVLGRTLRTDTDLRSAIREGFPQKVVGSVMSSARLTLKELSATLDLSPHSLQRRRHQGRLARYESDRLYRLARIVALSKQFIGDEETAARWLRRSSAASLYPACLAFRLKSRTFSRLKPSSTEWRLETVS